VVHDLGTFGVCHYHSLQSWAGAFRGTTTIKPWRVNVWGTIISVAIGTSGIQQFGGTI
jgi:hypothetical protein